jgi:tRNA nucleotidyltransferase (CCA-adding enzyme)
LGLDERAYPPRERLLGILAAARAVDTAAIASQAREQGLDGEQIGARIHQVRTEVVADYLRREMDPGSSPG